LNLPDVQFPKLATRLESDPLIVLQLLELKPLGHAVYLFSQHKNLRTQQPGFTLTVGFWNTLENSRVKPSAGFKPAPFLLEARHSVQLSYEGMGIWARIKLATSGFARQRSVH
jgi:hypothetical protein